MFIVNADNNFTAVYSNKIDVSEVETGKTEIFFYTVTPLGFIIENNEAKIFVPPFMHNLIFNNLHGIYDKTQSTYTSPNDTPRLSTDFKETLYIELARYAALANLEFSECTFFLNKENVTAQVLAGKNNDQ